MATVLTVHVVETVWTRRREGGIVAPYLVIDHNGQQQHTEVSQAGTATTAWNQKASFPYAPTSDLVVMAFDAGCHGGIFLGQAVVDVATMLQEGQLHATASLTSSAGTTVGHVAFDVDLSTTSKTLAASLGIPGLTLSPANGKHSSKNHGSAAAALNTSSGVLLDDHLSISNLPVRMQGSVQTGHISQQQQPGQLMLRLSNTNIQADNAADGHPLKRGQKLGSLGQMLGLNMHRPRTSEGSTSSPAHPATPGSAAAAARSSTDSVPELAGGPRPLLARRSMLRSSQSSFSGPTAPLMTASMTATQAAVLQETFVASAAGTAAGAVAIAGGEPAATAGAAAEFIGSPVSVHGGSGSPASAEKQQRPEHIHLSNACGAVPSSMSSGAGNAATGGSRANRQTDVGSPVAAASRNVPVSPPGSQHHRHGPGHAAGLSMSVTTPKAVEAQLSPLRSNRRNLQLAPRPGSVSPEQKRLQQQQQIERDLERLQQLALQESAAHLTLEDDLADAAAHEQLDSDLENSSSIVDDQLLKEFEAADPAEKEAILYRQLMLQQVERKAGSAQLLKLLAAQQHQEALHDSNLLAKLASMSPGSSPRHYLNDRALTQSPGGRYYPDIPQPVIPDGRAFSCQQLAATGASSRQGNGGTGSSGGGSSQNAHSGSNKSHFYPTIPAFTETIDQRNQQQRQQQQVANGRKQWATPKHAAAAAAGIKSNQEPSGNSDLWQSCESGSEAATPTSFTAVPAHSSKGSRHSKAADAADAAGGAASAQPKRHPGKLSRLHYTNDGASSSSPKDIRSYPVDDATLDSAREHDCEEGAADKSSAMRQDAVAAHARYFTGSSSSADGGKADRWYDRYMNNTAAYPEPESVFPARAVVVAPSAPVG